MLAEAAAEMSQQNAALTLQPKGGGKYSDPDPGPAGWGDVTFGSKCFGE